MFYAGAPFLVKSRVAQVCDFDKATGVADRLMSGYDLNGLVETGGPGSGADAS